jgi:Fic family protein
MENHRVYTWNPIQDLPENWRKYIDTDFNQCLEHWNKVKKQLSFDVSETIKEKINREWAVETGQVEGLYLLGKGLTETLIDRGLEALEIPHNAVRGIKSPLRAQALILDQKNVIDGLFSYVKSEQPLTCHYVRALHAELVNAQDTVTAVDSFGEYVEIKLIKEAWKQRPNNPRRHDGLIHEYCPPEHVQSEMDRLIFMHNDHIKRGIYPEIESAWLHHRFTQIHPFQDGNGRVARCLASLVLIKYGTFPLLVTLENRVQYIAALEEADNNNLHPLVKFISSSIHQLMDKVLQKYYLQEFI